MQRITPKRKEIDPKDFLKRPASESDFSTLIDQDTILLDSNGNPIALYFKFTEDTSELVNALKKIPYLTSYRSGGLTTTSRIFGFDPPTGIRKQWPSATSLSWESPREHSTVIEFGRKINEIYKQYLPDAQILHEKTVKENVLPEWCIPGTPFTSGIINQNNQLNYHKDSGNFKGVYSNMIVMKSNVGGGYLSLPEYDLGLQCADNTLVMFDGQSILHGVTPIKKYSTSGYRYSIVYYSLSAFAKVGKMESEIQKIRGRRQKIEKNNTQR